MPYILAADILEYSRIQYSTTTTEVNFSLPDCFPLNSAILSQLILPLQQLMTMNLNTG